ncbi:MAG TPA: phosphatidylinositol kinase [Gammaproteobacteria bacterium]|nr:phosphatidylinositol kinase [Gammaproteobacteria bacterium]
MPYPILELPKDAPIQLEQLGTKTKFWYESPTGQKMLFKEGRPGTGENWAEKVCCEICKLLGLPHADYELALWNGHAGVVTPSFVPEGGRLVLGNELLARIVDDYDQSARFRARQHTVRIVMKIASASSVGFPLDWQSPEEISDAAGVFVGYLLLDALVSNQDRHHENWGLVLVPDQGLFLAPTFDHASSLGRNEKDKRRVERLTTKDKGRTVQTYVERARSAFFSSRKSTKPLKTLEAFREAAKIRPDAADCWRERLSEINPSQYMGIFDEMPGSEISVPARDFACRMLEINTKRLLDFSF